MKQYGEYLKELREARGLSIEQVSEDTKIVTDVIEALENMNKEKMASEMHLVGFIKLYAKYLGGDEEKALALFKSTAVSETPIQFDVINISKKKQNAKQKRKRSPVLFIVSVLVVLCGVGLWWTYPKVRSFIAERAKQQGEESVDITTVTSIYENTFDLKETILLVKGESEATAVVTSISPPIISIGETKYTLEENTPTPILLSENVEYIVILREINLARRSLLLRFDPRTSNPRVPQTQENVAIAELNNAVEEVLEDADGEVFQVLSSPVMRPIQLRLGTKIADAVYYQYENSEELLQGFINTPILKTVPETQYIDLSVSNAAAITLQINEVAIPVPQKSLPMVFRIGWRAVRPTENRLLIVPLP